MYEYTDKTGRIGIQFAVDKEDQLRRVINTPYNEVHVFWEHIGGINTPENHKLNDILLRALVEQGLCKNCTYNHYEFHGENEDGWYYYMQTLTMKSRLGRHFNIPWQSWYDGSEKLRAHTDMRLFSLNEKGEVVKMTKVKARDWIVGDSHVIVTNNNKWGITNDHTDSKNN